MSKNGVNKLTESLEREQLLLGEILILRERIRELELVNENLMAEKVNNHLVPLNTEEIGSREFANDLGGNSSVAMNEIQSNVYSFGAISTTENYVVEDNDDDDQDHDKENNIRGVLGNNPQDMVVEGVEEGDEGVKCCCGYKRKLDLSASTASDADLILTSERLQRRLIYITIHFTKLKIVI